MRLTQNYISESEYLALQRSPSVSKKLPPICSCCGSMVLETAIRWLMHPTEPVCLQCFMEWYDNTSPDPIDATDSQQLGKWIRKKYKRIKYSAKWSYEKFCSEIQKLQKLREKINNK